jgi:hypothetical protein
MRPFLSALTLLGALLAARPAFPCAIAPPPGGQVAIEHEDALIAWDPKAGVEHFIRRARFETTAGDFGFLVPTPSQPELAEVSGALFNRLEAATRPEVEVEEGVKLEPMFLCFGMTLSARGSDGAFATATAKSAVNVLEQKQVGSLDAAVLEATHVAALLEWLEKNGYPHGPELDGWLAPYVKAGWKITAFKISSGAQKLALLDGVSTMSSVVRMSFPTAKPFYPYREPLPRQGTVASGNRSLRVWLVAPGRLDGVLGEGGRSWPGRLEYAAPRTDLGTLLADAVPREAMPQGGWLTEYVDPSSPRRGTDEVFFHGSSDSTLVVRPPVFEDRRTVIPLPLELFFLGFIGVGVVLVRRRRGT